MNIVERIHYWKPYIESDKPLCAPLNKDNCRNWPGSENIEKFAAAILGDVQRLESYFFDSTQVKGLLSICQGSCLYSLVLRISVALQQFWPEKSTRIDHGNLIKKLHAINDTISSQAFASIPESLLGCKELSKRLQDLPPEMDVITALESINKQFEAKAIDLIEILTTLFQTEEKGFLERSLHNAGIKNVQDLEKLCESSLEQQSLFSVLKTHFDTRITRLTDLKTIKLGPYLRWNRFRGSNRKPPPRDILEIKTGKLYAPPYVSLFNLKKDVADFLKLDQMELDTESLPPEDSLFKRVRLYKGPQNDLLLGIENFNIGSSARCHLGDAAYSVLNESHNYFWSRDKKTFYRIYSQEGFHTFENEAWLPVEENELGKSKTTLLVKHEYARLVDLEDKARTLAVYEREGLEQIKKICHLFKSQAAKLVEHNYSWRTLRLFKIVREERYLCLESNRRQMRMQDCADHAAVQSMLTGCTGYLSGCHFDATAENGAKIVFKKHHAIDDDARYIDKDGRAFLIVEMPVQGFDLSSIGILAERVKDLPNMAAMYTRHK